MKINHLALWSAVTAVSFVAVTVPVRAADTDQDKSTSGYRKTTHLSDKAINDVERANKLIGKEVRGSDNQKLGKIENFIVDLETGRILYAIIGSGGVAGVGEKKYAVAPGMFTETQGKDTHLNMDKAKFAGAPEFTKEMDKDTELGKADFVFKTYQYFGQNAWWQGNTPASEGSFHNVHKVSDLIGMKVQNVSNQDIGKVDNVILDVPDARVLFVIFNPDRSLGLSENYYALPPNALTLGSDRKFLVSDLGKEKLSAAPHFDKDNWPNFSNPSWAGQVYKYYGKDVWFDTNVQPTSEREKQRVYPDKK
jgi:sporulation protein YlmC with PRC-barrel domain